MGPPHLEQLFINALLTFFHTSIRLKELVEDYSSKAPHLGDFTDETNVETLEKKRDDCSRYLRIQMRDGLLHSREDIKKKRLKSSTRCLLALFWNLSIELQKRQGKSGPGSIFSVLKTQNMDSIVLGLKAVTKDLEEYFLPRYYKKIRWGRSFSI
jgi:hypothetical protein